MLGNLIGGFIVILVGATLAPTVANEVQFARYGNGSEAPGVINITGASSTNSFGLGHIILLYGGNVSWNRNCHCRIKAGRFDVNFLFSKTRREIR